MTRSKPFALAGLLTLLLITGCSDPDPIVIGYMGGTSGRVADLGVSGRNGTMLAVEQANAEGGINGRPIELLLWDDQQDPDRARKGMRTLIDNGIVALIGPMTSAMGVSIVDIANEARLPVIGGTVTTSDLTGKDDYFFRVLTTAPPSAMRLSSFLRRNTEIERVAVVYDSSNSAYSESWLSGFSDHWTGAGGEIIDTVSFESSPDVNLSLLAQSLLKDNPDGVALIVNSVDAAILIKEIRQQSPGTRLFTAEWAGTDRLLTMAGRYAEGVIVTQYFNLNSEKPSYLAFSEIYRQRFKQQHGYPAVTTYTSTQVLLEALRKNAETDLKKTILSMSGFQAVLGVVEFDQYGDSKAGSFISEVKNGQYEVIGP